jgi:molybdopterin molybdotransferase
MNSPLLSVDAALEQLLAAARQLERSEELPLLECAGRVLARSQFAKIDVPPVDNSAMDGYAVASADCTAAGARLPIAQRIAAGQTGAPLERGTAARIFTGAPIPSGADAIVMQERCRTDGDAVIIDAVPRSGEWIRRRGEDIHAGAQILPAGVRLTPQRLGLAASIGIAQLPVFDQLRAGVFYTGDELVMPGEPLPPGRIYNSNRFTLQPLLRGLGCQVTDYGNVPDRLQSTREVLRQAAAENDLIITSGGVSVGEEDHVKPAVEAEGELRLWKIAIKPGKPLAFGRVANSAFIGLPGNPVSSFITFLLFVRPFIQRCQGLATAAPAPLPMRAEFDWPKPDARREYLRVRHNGAGGLELFPNQGSAVMTSTVWGDGLVDNPAGQAIRRGDAVRYLPFSDLLA